MFSFPSNYQTPFVIYFYLPQHLKFLEIDPALQVITATMSSSQVPERFVPRSMTSTVDYSGYIFYFTSHADKEPIKITWNLRSQFEKTWPVDLIKSRPPFLNAGFVTNPQADAIMQKYFPDLKERESYSLGIFGQTANRHLMFIYDLEGYLQKDWVIPVNHVLAGMNHFAQYLQGVVYIAQSPIRVSNNAIDTKPITILPNWLKQRRLVIFLIKDEVRKHYCLSWVDRKAGKIFLIDSHPDGYESMPTGRLDTIERTIRGFLNECGSGEPAHGITRIWNTRQEFEDHGSDLHVMNNLRMLLLENQERISQRDSGYMNWSNSFCFQKDYIPQAGSKEETIREMMITTFKMELGSKGNGLRWPEQPAIETLNSRLYFTQDKLKPEGGTFKPNWVFLPEGANPAELSTEDVPQVAGRDTRSISVMAGHCFAMRQQSMGARQASYAPGTPLATPQPETPKPKAQKTKEQLMARVRDLNRETSESMTPPSERPRDKIKARERVVVHDRPRVRRDSETGTSQLVNQRIGVVRMGSEPNGRHQMMTIQPGRAESIERPMPAPSNYSAPFLANLPNRPVLKPPTQPAQGKPTNERYSFRDRAVKTSAPRPKTPEYDDVWDEPRDVIAQPDVDERFMGWDYMMSLERWNRSA